jgi:phage N-6-adenine-methyltransferase
MANDTWQTPPQLFSACEKRFGKFDIDVAASNVNYQVINYFTEKDNALQQSWAGMRCWCNPPYSDIMPWVKKATEECLKGAVITMLLKCDTSTAWFKEIFRTVDELYFLQPRVRFVGAPTTPTWGCMIARWTSPHILMESPKISLWRWDDPET